MSGHACGTGAPRPPEATGRTIALAGNPNVGKSTIFNALTGLDTLTTNYPGATVEASMATVRVDGHRFTLIDLPGTYGLAATTEDQRVAWRVLLEQRPDAVIAVADATNLARNLYLVLQLLDLGLRVVLALNLSDVAERTGIVIDTARLEEMLGIPVVRTTATRGRGITDATSRALQLSGQPAARRHHYGHRLEEEVARLASRLNGQTVIAPRGAALMLLEGTGTALPPIARTMAEHTADVQASAGRIAAATGEPAPLAIARERHALAERIAGSAGTTRAGIRGRQAWRIATRPVTGLPLLLMVLAAVFAALFGGGSFLAVAFDAAWRQYASPPIRAAVTWIFGAGTLTNTLLWGVDAGLNAVLSVGIPYVLTFYVMLALLEDTGYLNAAAILLDRVMSKIGLTGRAAIPLVAGAGCNVPAIIGLRVLRSERERLIAGTLITLVPCSARTAVIFGAVARFIGWQAAVGLYAIVSAVILGAGWGLNRYFPGRPPDLLMEIFPFRVPGLRTVIRKTWARVREFIGVAAPVVLMGSIVLGALYETGIIRAAARPLAPVVEGWLGLPAVAGLTLVFAVLRKELALQLLAALAIAQFGRGADNLLRIMTREQIFTYALVNTIYIPCVATIAVLARALGWKRAALISAGTVALAVALGGLVMRALTL